MSFALEFYSISWDALKAALVERKPELLFKLEEVQWPGLLEDTDLGQPEHHLFADEPNPLSFAPGSSIREGFDELTEVVKRQPAAANNPPEVSDKAALVFAALVRALGKPVGVIRHDGSVASDKDGELPMDFRAMFLDGVAGSCLNNHRIGETLVARPLFGLFHLDFLSWGGLSRSEIAELLPKYAPPSTEEKADEEWQVIAASAQGWLDDLMNALRGAAAAQSDLVTLYLTVQEHYGSLGAELDDEMRGDFSWFGKVRSFFKKAS